MFLVLRAISIIIAVDGGGGGGLTIGLINFNRLIQFYINFSYMRNQFRIYPLTELTKSPASQRPTEIQRRSRYLSRQGITRISKRTSMRIYCQARDPVQTTSSADSIKLIAHVRIKERVLVITSPPGTASSRSAERPLLECTCSAHGVTVFLATYYSCYRSPWRECTVKHHHQPASRIPVGPLLAAIRVVFPDIKIFTPWPWISLGE